MRQIGICVYGGASSHVNEVYLNAAHHIGQEIAKRGWTLVNGAGDTGMMGNTIRGAKELDGNTIGVAPFFFRTPGTLYEEGEETLYTRTMRERKAFMESLSSAFITTPGGIGTLEEFFEILTLKQLQQLDRPLILLNIDHYYDSLIHAMQDMTNAGFIHESTFDLFKICSSVEEAFQFLDQQLTSNSTI